MPAGGADGPPPRSTGTGSAGLKRIWTFMTTGLYALLTVWRLAIGKINKALLFLDYGLRRRTDFFHKVVLLGDGLATGFGAWVNLGSLSGLVKHLNEAAPTRVGLKTEWAFFERGVLNSTTRDWLPAQAGGPGMIDKVMGSRACRDVEVAVLLVGLQDMLQIRDAGALVALAEEDGGGASGGGGFVPSALWRVQEQEEDEGEENKEGDAAAATGTPLVQGGEDAAVTGEEIVANLRAIVEYLCKDRGVHVVLCTLPLVGAPTSVRARAVAGIDRRIVAMAKSLHLGKDMLTVVDLSQPRVSRPWLRSFDGIHFTSVGYKTMADAILDEMLPGMVRFEWKILQDYVTGRKPKPVGGVRGLVGGLFGGGGGGDGGGGRAPVKEDKKGK